jgi:hypothetical protein
MNLINYGSDSDILTRYGSGSTWQKVTVPTLPVPVPQHCLQVEGEDVLLVELTGRTRALVNDLVHYGALRLGQQFDVVFGNVADLCKNSFQPSQNTGSWSGQCLGSRSGFRSGHWIRIRNPESKRTKMTHKNRKSLEISCFEVLDVQF